MTPAQSADGPLVRLLGGFFPVPFTSPKDTTMTIFIGLIAGIASFVGTALVASILMGLLAEAHQFFALLFRVQPYRTVFNLALALGSAWAGFSAFDAIA